MLLLTAGCECTAHTTFTFPLSTVSRFVFAVLQLFVINIVYDASQPFSGRFLVLFEGPVCLSQKEMDGWNIGKCANCATHSDLKGIKLYDVHKVI